MPEEWGAVLVVGKVGTTIDTWRRRLAKAAVLLVETSSLIERSTSPRKRGACLLRVTSTDSSSAYSALGRPKIHSSLGTEDN